MVQQIFVNLPVKDLDKTKAFWISLGFSFNPQFTDDNAASLVLGENIFAMLLKEEFFKTFTARNIINAHNDVEVLNCISLESKEAVNEIVDKAVANGARETKSQDHGWMYLRGFEDLDGHGWEVMHADMSKLPQE